jgi:hypothetical protein
VSAGDWIQVATLVAVAVALLLNVRQIQELTRQNSAIVASLRQSAYHVMVTDSPALRVSFLKDNPQVLAWHMATRGFTSGTHEQNLQRLYILARLEAHELNFTSHKEGLLTDDVWAGWGNVVKMDIADADFRETWRIAKHMYAPSFVTFIDAQIDGGRGPKARRGAAG